MNNQQSAIKPFKKYLFIFALGLLVGAGITACAQADPRQAIVSPISPTLAESEELISPLGEEDVLGVEIRKDVEKEENKQRQTETADQQMEEQEVRFSELLASEVRPSEDKPTGQQTSDYQGEIKIALFGDSMTDLMGTNLPYLKTALEKYYPQADFNLLNYGVGAQNIEEGLQRIEQQYNYKNRKHHPLVASDAQVIIIDPFVYNPFPEQEGEMDRHWTALVQLVSRLQKQTSAEIMLLATIAPAKSRFGVGPNGVNWENQQRRRHAQRINQYLENTCSFARSADLPLIDVYHQTLLENGEGDLRYINPGDHIHQNVKGNQLIAQTIAEKIFKKGIGKY